MKEEELTGKIIGCAMKVHRTLGEVFSNRSIRMPWRMNWSDLG